MLSISMHVLASIPIETQKSLQTLSCQIQEEQQQLPRTHNPLQNIELNIAEM